MRRGQPALSSATCASGWSTTRSAAINVTWALSPPLPAGRGVRRELAPPGPAPKGGVPLRKRRLGRGAWSTMRFRRRRSLFPRLSRRPSPEEAAPLKGQLWTRSERNLKEPDVHPMRRVVAAAVAVAEGALLGWLWFGPALAVTSVDISGAHHLTAAQVAAVVGLSGSGSVLAVDGESDRHHLLDQAWAPTATVDPQPYRPHVVHL